MSETNFSLKSKKRNRSGKKSKKISFDEEIVPKSIAQQFNNPEKNKSNEFELHEKPRNKTKQKAAVENSDSGSSSHQPTKQKRKKKPSQSEKNMETNENTEREENLEESHQLKKQKRKKKSSQSEKNMETDENTERVENLEESQEHPDEDAEVNPSNPVVKQEESKRSQKRRKHQLLLLEKKVKVDLVLQEKSLNYLSRWKHNRNEWKFEKLRQVWLQQSMFDSDKIPEQFWKTLVEYFSGAKGLIRSTIIAEALKIIKENEREAEQNNEDEGKESEDNSNINRVQRARDIIQCLDE